MANSAQRSAWHASLAAVLVALTAAGCKKNAKEEATPDMATSESPAPASSVSASAFAPAATSSPTPLVVSPPTDEPHGMSGMHYFNWKPAAKLARAPGESEEALAARVLQSAELAQRLKIRPGIDAFVRRGEVSNTKDQPPHHQIGFRQVYAWRGQQVPVHEAFATVELTPDGALAYVGTGFRAGVSLPDKPTSVDEQKAAEIAIKDYEVQEKVSAASTPHREPGLMVHAPQGVLLVPWKGDTLAYQIHAEAKDPKGGFSRPFMYLIDAFSGTILARRQAWVE